MKGTFDLKKVLIVSLVAWGLVVLAVYCANVAGSGDALRGTLASTQDALAVAQAELLSARGDLASTQSTLVATQQQLSMAIQERDVAQGTLAGLGVTVSASVQCYDADLVDNPEAVNPSWDELLSFLTSDRTEDHEYSVGVYDCSEFSRDVHNNAETAGIRAAVVHVHTLYSLSDHALNAFLTTDCGLVYVDCSGGGVDTIAYVEKDKRYKAVEVDAVSPADVRNSTWWNSLASWEYFHLPGWACTISIYGGSSVCAAATGNITIFW